MQDFSGLLLGILVTSSAYLEVVEVQKKKEKIEFWKEFIGRSLKSRISFLIDSFPCKSNLIAEYKHFNRLSKFF